MFYAVHRSDLRELNFFKIRIQLLREGVAREAASFSIAFPVLITLKWHCI